MLSLDKLTPAPGSVRKRKRVGRGNGSGHGKTSGRGHKGYGSRTGYKTAGLFEGGQMPLHRRLPKRGFTNHFKKIYEVVNLRDMDRLSAGDVTPEILKMSGLIQHADGLIKILGDGDITKSFNFSVHKVSKSALEKIEAAGGKVTLLC